MNIIIAEEISNATVTYVLKEMLTNSKDPQINVYINSEGGELDAAYAIYELLRLSGKRVITYALNNVCSAAVVIYLASDERLASNYSTFMIHEPSHEYGDGARFGTTKYKNNIKDLNKITEDYFKLIAKHTSLTIIRIKNATADTDWYFKTAHAKKLGLVTKIGLPS